MIKAISHNNGMNINDLEYSRKILMIILYLNSWNYLFQMGSI
jgi:hypothetical protein